MRQFHLAFGLIFPLPFKGVKLICGFCTVNKSKPKFPGNSLVEEYLVLENICFSVFWIGIWGLQQKQGVILRPTWKACLSFSKVWWQWDSLQAWKGNVCAAERIWSHRGWVLEAFAVDQVGVGSGGLQPQARGQLGDPLVMVHQIRPSEEKNHVPINLWKLWNWGPASIIVPCRDLALNCPQFGKIEERGGENNVIAEKANFEIDCFND